MPALIFSGQGSQKEKMGEDLSRKYDVAASIYQQASRQLEIDLIRLDKEQLSQTLYAQLAIVTLSYAAYRTWSGLSSQEERNSDPSCLAGFSLGEYTALAASGVLAFNDLLDLIRYRAEAMQEASGEYSGVMIAVIGLDKDIVQTTLSENTWIDKVWLANDNAPGQIVIAGFDQETLACSKLLKERGARRLVQLDVSGAFHTPLMNTAAEKLEKYAAKLNFKAPQKPIYSNTYAAPVPENVNWPAYLSTHMRSTVRWTETIKALAADGHCDFIEFGPGKVLSGLVRKTLKNVSVRQIGTADDLQGID